MELQSVHQERLVSRWRFLEDEADPSCVLTRSMEVLYLNAAARTLVPLRWFGCRCWEIFPVGDESCVSRCPAVKAVNKSEDIVYCEETLYSKEDGSPIRVGVAVIPLSSDGRKEEKALLLIRPKAAGGLEADFQRSLLERAEVLRASLIGRPSNRSPRKRSKRAASNSIR
jgi:hypothetical protein